MDGETEVIGEDMEDVNVKTEEVWPRGDGEIKDRLTASSNAMMVDHVEHGERVVIDGREEVVGSGARSHRITKLRVPTVEVTKQKQGIRQGAGFINESEDVIELTAVGVRMNVESAQQKGYIIDTKLREGHHATSLVSVLQFFHMTVLQIGVNVIDNTGGACLIGSA